MEPGGSTCNLRGLWLPLPRGSNESSDEFDQCTKGGLHRELSEEQVAHPGEESGDWVLLCSPDDGEIWVSPSISLREIVSVSVRHLSVESSGTERKGHS